MQAERERIVGAIVAAVQGDDRRAGVPWFVLRRGRVPPAGDADAQQALNDEIGRVAEGRPPQWMPPAVVEAIEQRPDYVIEGW